MIGTRHEACLQRIWYSGSAFYLPLLPLSWLFCGVVALRSLLYRCGLLASRRLTARVIVVGNLTAGGTGKTPLVIAIARRLRQAGYRVGIITRGYGGRADHWPQPVDSDSDPLQLGDEPVLLARHSGAVVWAGPDRVAAARALLDYAECDVLISDDGLQHYALQRDLEIMLVDAARGLGNGHCLPAGPLREPRSRLSTVDAVAAIGPTPHAEWIFRLQPGELHRVSVPAETTSLASLAGSKVYAVAGVGNPQRFFALLREAGLEIEERIFPDHYNFQPADLAFGDTRPVLMTEKDAVKCRGFAPPHCWYLPVTLVTTDAFDQWLLEQLV